MFDYDVVVVGAGIHGAGVAQACAAQGWRTLIIEKNQTPAMETSRSSSKLIHGGLRYLETAQFKLVYECLRERGILLKQAPELVRLIPFYIPVYQNHKRQPLWVALGLTVYNTLAWLSGGRKYGIRLGFETVPRSQWDGLGINTDGLKRVFRYWDAQTNDADLTRRVVASAESLGATFLANTSINAIDKQSTGVDVTLSDGRVISTRCLVNAAGPWVNHVAALSGDLPTQLIQWVQGTHLILNRPAPSGAIYTESPEDGRAVFILPWEGKVMVGTTELELDEPKAHATAAEVQYLLDVFNFYFPSQACTSDDIADTFAGIRVLPKAAPGELAHKLPRETIFKQCEIDSGGYLGIYGGKLTSYRATADAVLTRLAKMMDRRIDTSKSTRYVKLD